MTTPTQQPDALDIARECIAYEESGLGLHCEIFNGAVTAQMVLTMARAIVDGRVAGTGGAWPHVGARVVRRKHPDWGVGTIDGTQDGPLPWIVAWDDGGVTGVSADEIRSTAADFIRRGREAGHDALGIVAGTGGAVEPDHERIADWVMEQRHGDNQDLRSIAHGIRSGAWRGAK